MKVNRWLLLRQQHHDRTVLQVYSNGNITRLLRKLKGFRRRAKLIKKAAKLSEGFNNPKTGFFPVNKLISLSLRIIRLGGPSFTIFVLKPRFYT